MFLHRITNYTHTQIGSTFYKSESFENQDPTPDVVTIDAITDIVDAVRDNPTSADLDALQDALTDTSNKDLFPDQT